MTGKRPAKNPGDVRIGVWPTPWGAMGGARSAKGLCELHLPHYQPHDLRELLAWHYPGAKVEDRAFDELADMCSAYFNGEVVDFTPVDCDLSAIGPFGRQILTACRRIPYGQTQTYTQLAHSADQSGKARPTAQAMGKNPTPLVIPCHRVVAAGGLGGFSTPGGVAQKSRMLKLERGVK